MLRQIAMPLLLIAALVLTGCGGGKEDDKKDKKAESKQSKKKDDAKKDSKKDDGKKDTKKDDTKADVKKADTKADAKKDDTKKADTKADAKKDDTKKVDTKADAKKDDTKKADTKADTKADAKKDDTKKGDAKKDETKKAGGTAATEPKEQTVDELLEEFKSADRRQDLNGAISAVEKIAKKEAKHPITFFLPVLLQRKGFQLIQSGDDKDGYTYMLKAGTAFRAYLKAKGTEPNARDKALGNQLIYNEGCAHAKNKDLDKALASLKWAIELGFNDFKLLSEDEDMADVRKLDGYAAIAESVKKAAADAEKARAEQARIAREAEIQKIKKDLESFKPYPFTFALKDIDGKEVKLDDYKGKVMIVDVWGTWCPPCVQEIPHFVKLKKTYGEKGFDVVGINYERGAGAPEDKIRAFAKRIGINYTCVIGDTDTRAQIPDFVGFPTTLFIDRSGTVRLQAVGYKDYEVLETIVKKLLDDDAEPKKEEPKKESKEDIKKEEPKENAKKEEAKKAETKKEAGKKEEAKKEVTKKG